ncbi:aldehyde dehydrogenase family protein, partial [Salmonella enterica subsp. enterica serovar Montevideo]|nr:aldehyde dehydrogenase family protein [Salmonella enterica subsp. enterica serovar Montevideo]
EIFGPVACLLPFKDEAEGLRLANDVEYGLASYIWTQDVSKVLYPVNYRIRPAKMVTERLSGFNAYHFFGIHGIHHGNVIGKHRT